MPFTAIHGTFHVVNYEPDGDSMRFKAKDPANWNKLKGSVRLNARGHAQLRVEAIDTLETHYPVSGSSDLHQPRALAEQATDEFLEQVGITNVQWDAAHKKVTAANDGTPGYILARAAEKNGRPVSFVFAGPGSKPAPTDGKPFMLDKTFIKKSVNARLLAQGLAYPTYYQGLFPDLRNSLTSLVASARSAKKGVWAPGADVTNAGFKVTGMAPLQDQFVILPKLFRRLAEFLAHGGSVAQFVAFLAARPDPLLILSTGHFTNFDTLVSVVNKTVKVSEKPENLVFSET